jgi:hypothetical protein
MVYGAGQNYRFQLGINQIGSNQFPMMVELDGPAGPPSEVRKISVSGTHTVAISCVTTTKFPTTAPSHTPTHLPTVDPTQLPTPVPTLLPTGYPTTENPTPVSLMSFEIAWAIPLRVCVQVYCHMRLTSLFYVLYMLSGPIEFTNNGSHPHPDNGEFSFCLNRCRYTTATVCAIPPAHEKRLIYSRTS